MSPTFLWQFMILDYCCIDHQIKYFFLLFPLKRLRTSCNGVALNQDTGMKWGMKMPVLNAWKTSRDIPVAIFHRTSCSYFWSVATAQSSSCCPGQLKIQEPLAHIHIQPGEGAQAPISFTFGEWPQKCHWWHPSKDGILKVLKGGFHRFFFSANINY